MRCDSCGTFLVQPARVLETWAFSEKSNCAENCLVRNIARRLIALVAPIFYFYEFLLASIAVIFDFTTCSVCRRDLAVGMVTEEQRKGIDRVISYRIALDALRDTSSSFCEIPQKVFCASKVNYWGSPERSYGEIMKKEAEIEINSLARR